VFEAATDRNRDEPAGAARRNFRRLRQLSSHRLPFS
jgi:hypothetical protein